MVTEVNTLAILEQCKENDLLCYIWNLGKDKIIFRYGGKYKIDGPYILVSRKSILVYIKDAPTVSKDMEMRFIHTDKPTPLLLDESVAVDKEAASQFFGFPTKKDIQQFKSFEDEGNIEKEEGEILLNAINQSIRKIGIENKESNMITVLQECKMKIWNQIYNS